MNPFSRTQFVLGSDAMEKLKNARVAVFGVGGVGGYVVEALARSGVGALDLVDHDTISLTNINRQILATRDTVGMDKAEAAAQLGCIGKVNQHHAGKTNDTAQRFLFCQFLLAKQDTCKKNGHEYVGTFYN